MLAKMIALDWRAMKYYQIRLLLLPVFLLIFGYYSSVLVVPISVVLLLGFSVNTFAVEEKGELNNLYLTLPIKRTTIVTGRYMLSFILMLCGILLGLIIGPLANRYALSKWYIGINGYIAVISISYLLYAILNLFIYPILFWLGYQKGKFWGFYLPVIFFSVLFSSFLALSYLPEHNTLMLDIIVYATEHLYMVVGIVSACATAILIISYLISLKVYSRRNF